MRMTARIAAGAVALAVLASQAGAVQLRYNFKAGETHSYKTTMKGRGETKSSAMPEPMRLEMALEAVATQKVLSVAAGGKSAQLEQQLKSGTITMTVAGQSHAIPMPATRVVMSVTDRGKVLSMKTTTPEGDEMMFGASMQGADWSQLAAAMAFPEKDLKVNDTWETSASTKLGEERTLKVQARSRLLKLVTYKGRPCAQIRTWFEMPLQPLMTGTGDSAAAPDVQGKLTGLLTWYFDHTQGLVVDQSGTIKMLMKMAFTMGEYSTESSTSTVMNVTSVLQK